MLRLNDRRAWDVRRKVLNEYGFELFAIAVEVCAYAATDDNDIRLQDRNGGEEAA